MIKPNNFDNVQALGGYTPIELGGHILIIKEVVEYRNPKGTRMAKISYDTHETDKQPKYYSDQWKKDSNKADRIWRGFFLQVIENSNGVANVGFVTFIKSIEASNPGFIFNWDEKTLAGKLVGATFGRQEYEKDGESKFTTKLFLFNPIDVIKKGVKVPADKLLSGSSYNNSDLIPVNNGGDLPF